MLMLMLMLIFYHDRCYYLGSRLCGQLHCSLVSWHCLSQLSDRAWRADGTPTAANMCCINLIEFIFYSCFSSA